MWVWKMENTEGREMSWSWPLTTVGEIPLPLPTSPTTSLHATVQFMKSSVKHDKGSVSSRWSETCKYGLLVPGSSRITFIITPENSKPDKHSVVQADIKRQLTVPVMTKNNWQVYSLLDSLSQVVRARKWKT